MNDTRLFLLILVMGVVTYVTRRAFLRLPESFLTVRMKNGLAMIPVGIFAALIFPSLFTNGGKLSIDPLYLMAGAVCLVLMKLSRNIFLSFGASMLLVVLVKTRVIPL